MMKHKNKDALSKIAKEVLTEFKNCSNGMFRLAKRLNIDSKEVEGERYMIGSDETCFGEKERGKIWKDYMERITNEKN